jgi:radical SAM protein with 4Fe4S-binding SPASM domain
VTILADGTVPLCSQDYEPRVILGDVNNQSLSSIWLGPAMNQLRRAHQDAIYTDYPLCVKCKEWHR